MKNRIKLVSLVIGVFVFFMAAMAIAEDFSADMVSTAKGMAFRGKIYMSKDKSRMEVPDGITISRMDKRVVWMLMPKDKMYMEQPLDPGTIMASSEKVDNEIERKRVGNEMIDGRMAEKYQIVYNQNGKRETLFQWFVSGLSIPVKTAAVDNSWSMEYKNIKTGKQPDALFEVPAGYEKFSYQMPSMKDVLGGMIQ